MSTPSTPAPPPGPAIQYVFYDTETSGLNPKRDELIEIAFNSFDRPDLNIQALLPLPPGKTIAVDAMQIHGISPDMLPVDSKVTKDLESRLLQLLRPDDQEGQIKRGKVILIAHNNMDFDKQFFRKTFPLLSQCKWLLHADSLVAFDQALKIPQGQLALHKLAKRYNVETPQTHRAMADVELLMAVVAKLTDTEKDKFYANLQRQCLGARKA